MSTDLVMGDEKPSIQEKTVLPSVEPQGEGIEILSWSSTNVLKLGLGLGIGQGSTRTRIDSDQSDFNDSVYKKYRKYLNFNEKTDVSGNMKLIFLFQPIKICS
jgi:hypothetical protein